jgi:hypothetical protein
MSAKRTWPLFETTSPVAELTGAWYKVAQASVERLLSSRRDKVQAPVKVSMPMSCLPFGIESSKDVASRRLMAGGICSPEAATSRSGRARVWKRQVDVEHRARS